MKENRKTLPRCTWDVKSADYPTMDDRLSDEALKSSGRLKQKKTTDKVFTTSCFPINARQKIADMGWIDFYTFKVTLTPVQTGSDEYTTTIAEYWPEQDKVMFTDEHYDEDGTYTGNEISTLLTDEEKEKVKEIIWDVNNYEIR